MTLREQFKGIDVAAKKRKRCHGCNKMVEVGEAATIRDETSIQDGHTFCTPGVKSYRVGSWHTYHRDCFDKLFGAVAAASDAPPPVLPHSSRRYDRVV